MKENLYELIELMNEEDIKKVEINLDLILGPEKVKSLRIKETKLADPYADLMQPKRKEIKVTFELDEEVVKLLNKLAVKFPHGFKKTFANNAIKNEAKRVAELHNIKL